MSGVRVIANGQRSYDTGSLTSATLIIHAWQEEHPGTKNTLSSFPVPLPPAPSLIFCLSMFTLLLLNPHSQHPQHPHPPLSLSASEEMWRGRGELAVITCWLNRTHASISFARIFFAIICFSDKVSWRTWLVIVFSSSRSSNLYQLLSPPSTHTHPPQLSCFLLVPHNPAHLQLQGQQVRCVFVEDLLIANISKLTLRTKTHERDSPRVFVRLAASTSTRWCCTTAHASRLVCYWGWSLVTVEWKLHQHTRPLSIPIPIPIPDFISLFLPQGEGRQLLFLSELWT